MKAFSFRLQHVLNLREQEESLWKLRLGQASRVVEDIDLGITRTQSEEHGALGYSHDPRAMFVAQHYILRMQAERKKLEADRIKAEERRKEMLVSYTRATQKAETLRKLRERQFVEWRKLWIETQDAQLDDLVAAGRIQTLRRTGSAGEV